MNETAKPKRIRNRSKKPTGPPPGAQLIGEPDHVAPVPYDWGPDAPAMPIPPMPTPSLRYGMKTPDVVWWMFTYKPVEAAAYYAGKTYAEPDLNAPMPVGDWDAN